MRGRVFDFGVCLTCAVTAYLSSRFFVPVFWAWLASGFFAGGVFLALRLRREGDKR